MPYGEQLYKVMRALGIGATEVGNLLGVSESGVRTYKARPPTAASPSQTQQLIAFAKDKGLALDLEFFYLSDADPSAYVPDVVAEARASYAVASSRETAAGLAVFTVALNLAHLARGVVEGSASKAEAVARCASAGATCQTAAGASDPGLLRRYLEDASAELLGVSA